MADAAAQPPPLVKVTKQAFFSASLGGTSLAATSGRRQLAAAFLQALAGQVEQELPFRGRQFLRRGREKGDAVYPRRGLYRRWHRHCCGSRAIAPSNPSAGPGASAPGSAACRRLLGFHLVELHVADRFDATTVQLFCGTVRVIMTQIRAGDNNCFVIHDAGQGFGDLFRVGVANHHRQQLESSSALSARNGTWTSTECSQVSGVSWPSSGAGFGPARPTAAAGPGSAAPAQTVRASTTPSPFPRSAPAPAGCGKPRHPGCTRPGTRHNG